MRRIAALAFGFICIWQVAAADQCDHLEASGRLIHQQLRQSKVCRASSVSESWTDCEFQAGGTRILLVGAIGVSAESRMMGFLGSGFHVLSVDTAMTVRVIVDSEEGLALRLDGTDNLLPTGCLYNEAVITLDARVLGPGESVRKGPPPTRRESIRAAQGYLREIGYDPGPADGELGPRTRKALESYRRDRSISPESPEDLVFLRLLLEAMESAWKKLK